MEYGHFRCRIGSADILVSFDDSYPSNMWPASKRESENDTRHSLQGKFDICGKDVPRGYWVNFCLLFYFLDTSHSNCIGWLSYANTAIGLASSRC